MSNLLSLLVCISIFFSPFFAMAQEGTAKAGDVFFQGVKYPCGKKVKRGTPEEIVLSLYAECPAEVDNSRFDARLMKLYNNLDCPAPNEGPCEYNIYVTEVSQDSDISRLVIHKFDPERNLVTVTLTDYGIPHNIDFLFKQSRSGWRISDIRYHVSISSQYEERSLVNFFRRGQKR